MHSFGSGCCIETEITTFLQTHGLSPQVLDAFFWAGSSSFQPSFQMLPTPTHTETLFGHTGASGLAAIAVAAATIKETKANHTLVATLTSDGYGQLTLLGS